ncbi:kelch-like protein 32 isoform X2 [Amphiura filiformis]|uniref:kelch-like protein 32 isoform X2 n=1 Tax=Amphiura filiformis TaxID=82378 RepID=UPI003B21CE91
MLINVTMEEHEKAHLILVKPTSAAQGAQHGTFLKLTTSEPCQQKFQIPYNTKRDLGYKTLVGLNEQRKDDDVENSLCDVTLVIEGKRIHAHRAVLAVHSEYFRAMFTLGMMESRTKEVEMHNTTHTALSAAIEFMYTGAFLIWQEDLKDVLSTACMLQLDSLIELCRVELTNYLDVSNCLGMYKFAEIFSLAQLQDKAEDLIKRCFYSVVKEEEFVELDAALLAKIVSWDGLNLGATATEDDVVQAVVRWYKHNLRERMADVISVFKQLRLQQVSDSVLSQLKNDTDLSHNKDITELLNSNNPSQEPRSFSHHIYAIGGYRQSRTGGQTPQAKSIEVLNTYTKDWQYCGPLPKCLEPETLLTLNGKLLMSKLNKNKDQGEKWELCSYNSVTNIWKIEHDLQGLTSWLSWQQSGIELKSFVKAFDQKNKLLYFCGSLFQRVGAPCRRVFRYDLKNKVVKELPSLPESRFHHGAIVFNDKLYVIGGNDWENSAKDTTYVLDPGAESWLTKRPMNIPRVGVGLAVIDGHIYAVGGTNMMARQRSAERYDPVTDQWTSIANMVVPRAFHGMASAGGKIYAFGGKSYSQDAGARLVLQGSECYNKDADKWTSIGQMSQPHWRLATCIL